MEKKGEKSQKTFDILVHEVKGVVVIKRLAPQVVMPNKGDQSDEGFSFHAR